MPKIYGKSQIIFSVMDVTALEVCREGITGSQFFCVSVLVLSCSKCRALSAAGSLAYCRCDKELLQIICHSSVYKLTYLRLIYLTGESI